MRKILAVLLVALTICGNFTVLAENDEIQFVSCQMTNETFQADSNLVLNLKYMVTKKVSEDKNVYVMLCHNGEIIASATETPTTSMSKWITNRNYTITSSLTVPFNIPDGEYEVRTDVGNADGKTASDGNVALSLTLGEPADEPSAATFGNVSVNVNEGKIDVAANITLNGDVSSAKPYVKLLKENTLWAVCTGDEISLNTDGNTINFSVTPESDIPGGKYKTEIGFFGINGKTSSDEITVSNKENELYKPLSNGEYTAAFSGKQHFWYVNQNNTLIWDGEPYIPAGGMVTSMLMAYYEDGNNTKNKALWEQDLKDYKTIAEKGIKDIYINPTVSGESRPLWVWEYFFQELEKLGFCYGFQYGVSVRPFDSYVVRANEGKIQTTITQSGTVNVEWNGATYGGELTGGRYTLVDNQGDAVAVGICTVDGNTISADIVLPQQGEYTVVFTPQVTVKSSVFVNFWDNKDELKNVYKQLANVRAGDGLRVIVDHVRNESGMYNALESLRPKSENYNALFKENLIKKYNGIDEINDMWKVTPQIPDVETAARLIPVYTSDTDDNNEYTVYLCDENTNTLYAANGRTGVFWDDYLEFRDGAFAEFTGETAEIIKTGVDVPVIVKNVWGYKSYFNNKNQQNGIDGLGCEAYGTVQGIKNLMMSTYGMAREFKKTMWLVVTETSNNENVTQKYESGDYGYDSENDQHSRFNALLSVGAKGIYDFLMNCHYNSQIEKAYSYIENSDQFEWLTNFKNSLNAAEIDIDREPEKSVFLLPPDDNWYTSPNRYTCVLKDDTADTLTQPETQDDCWTMFTSDTDLPCTVIAANFQNAPKSVAIGKQFGTMAKENNAKVNSDKKVVYFGLRYDLGTVPEIDKYFTDSFAKVDGTTVQVLQPTSSSVVLKQTSDGKAWALRDGNLWIVATEKWHDTKSLYFMDDLGIWDAKCGFVSENMKLEQKDQYAVCTVNGNNYGTNDKKTRIVLAAYDDNDKLLDVKCFDESISTGDYDISHKLKIPASNTCIKAFFWDTGMNPLTTSASINIGILDTDEENLFQPNSENIFLMEAEQAEYDKATGTDESTGFVEVAATKASGGKLLITTTQGKNNTNAYKVSYNFDVKKSGNYDMWVVSSMSQTGQTSKLTPTINDVEQTAVGYWPYKGYNIYTGQASGDGIDGWRKNLKHNLYWCTRLSTQNNATWIKVGANEKLEVGKNNLTLTYTTMSHFMAIADCAVVIPSEMNWVPGDTVDVPTTASNKAYAWIEAENSTNAPTVFAKQYLSGAAYDDSKFSNGGWLRQFSGAVKDTEKLTYDFEVKYDGEYELWFLGMQQLDHLSKMYVSVDEINPSETETNRFSADSESTADVLYKDTDQEVRWQKSKNTINLKAGKHTLNVDIKERSSGGQYFRADVFVMVPTQMNFKAKDNVYGNLLELDAKSVEVYFGNEYNTEALTENIILPSTLAPGGSTLSFTFGGNCIAADGTVTRPAYGEDDGEGVVNIDVKKDKHTYTSEVDSNLYFVGFTIPAEGTV